jgi:hypothetical protein
MNKKKLLALLVSSAFLFAACGDDESSPLTPSNPEKTISSSSDDECDSDECEEKSSSSKKEENKSSSSKADDNKSSNSTDNKSSDSKENNSSSSTGNSSSNSSSSVSNSSASSSSSSVDVPQGAKAAKLEDLDKNIELNLFGQKVFLSTGSKQGVIALRIPDELWIVTYTDFANGEVKFVEKNVGVLYSDTDAAKVIKDKLTDGFKLSFIVDKDGKVKYAVNDSKDYSESVATKVSITAGKVSKAEDLKNKVYNCTDGDTTKVFNFYDGTYILEKKLSGKVVDWFAGNYDVQRSTLLMLPQFFTGKVYSLYNFSVGSEDHKISDSNGESMPCTVEAKTVKAVEKAQLVGDWQAYEDGVSWELSVSENGEYKFLAYEGTKNVEHKKGVWSIYGDNLLMRNTGCLNTSTCSTIFRGTIEKQTANGFTFKHDDTNTPHIPFEWSVAQVE